MESDFLTTSCWGGQLPVTTQVHPVRRSGGWHTYEHWPFWACGQGNSTGHMHGLSQVFVGRGSGIQGALGGTEPQAILGRLKVTSEEMLAQDGKTLS